jgi:hypothetical protein
VLAVAFPLYVTFVASTLSLKEVMQMPMPLLPGSHLVENYSQVLTGGTTTGLQGLGLAHALQQPRDGAGDPAGQRSRSRSSRVRHRLFPVSGPHVLLLDDLSSR